MPEAGRLIVRENMEGCREWGSYEKEKAGTSVVRFPLWEVPGGFEPP